MNAPTLTPRPRFTKAKLIEWATQQAHTLRHEFSRNTNYADFDSSKRIDQLKHDSYGDRNPWHFLNAAVELGKIDLLIGLDRVLSSATTKKAIKEALIEASESIYRTNGFDYGNGTAQLRTRVAPPFVGKFAHRSIDRGFAYGKVRGIHDAINRLS
jgi:hypothetical protein